MRTKKTGLWLVIGLMVVATCAPVMATDPDKININTAPAEELEQLQGVGKVIARKIVEYREQQGAFAAPEDLMNVPGIGPKTFDRNKERISVQ